MNKLRHRDLVLSLKYSTIESCFSVPMLNLTMSSFPFVVAFAVQELHWNAAWVGLMTALPHLCNCAQPIVIALLSRRFSTYQVIVLSFTLSAMPWAAAGFLPWLGPATNAVFWIVLTVATLANCVSSVAWSSAISDMVPPAISGKYFSRRNLIFGIWTLIVVYVVGHVVGHATDALAAFAMVFALAGLARMIGLLFLTRMRFPAPVRERQPRGLAMADIATALRDRNFLALILFIGVWGLAINASMPFYTVYLVNRLGFGVGEIVRLTTLASLGALITLKGWGRLCDQFGNRPVLHLCAMIWAVTALLMWLLTGPRWQWPLPIGYFLVGAVTAGFQLAQFNLMLKLSPAHERAAYVAVFMALTSLLTAFGPLLGGHLLTLLPHTIGELFKQPLTRFHLLFALAAVGSLAVTGLAMRIREPAEQPLENVWRAMKDMKSFNPMLSIMAVGELLLTPRSFLALGRHSWRSARQHVRALGDVGEEIVEGSREAMRKGFSSRD